MEKCKLIILKGKSFTSFDCYFESCSNRVKVLDEKFDYNLKDYFILRPNGDIVENFQFFEE